MLKRLMVGLFAVSLLVIWAAPGADARINIVRQGLNVTVYGEPVDDGVEFVTSIFGLEPYCQVRGTLYCAYSDYLSNLELAKLQCLQQTQAAAARVVVIDKDSIAKGAPYYYTGGDGPYYFTAEDVNFDIKDFGQRAQLHFFQQAVIAGSDDPSARRITLNVGTRPKEGFYAITQIPDNWYMDDDVSVSDALENYVGDPDGDFLVSPGFGVSGDGIKTDQYISKVPGIMPFGEQDIILGEQICGVVHVDQVKGDTLKGKYLGRVAFRVLDKSAYPMIDIEILDADDVCGTVLYNETGPVVGQASNGDYGCLTEDESVFAPAFSQGELVPGEGKFPVVQGTIELKGGEYKGTAKIGLQTYAGQQFCEERFAEYENITYVDFIPIDKDGGSDAFFHRIEYQGLAVAGTSELEDSTSICGEGSAGEISSTITSQYYDCKGYDFDIPTCPENPGSSLPCSITDYATFLKGQCDAYFNLPDGVESGIADDYCKPVEAKNFSGLWKFTPVALEAGNAIEVDRQSASTMIFSSEDYSSWGLYRYVDFGAGDNLILYDGSASKALNPYSDDGFPKRGSEGVDIYVCEFPVDSNPLNYLKHPLTVSGGQIGVFFNDRGGDADYDDIILVGEKVLYPFP